MTDRMSSPVSWVTGDEPESFDGRTACGMPSNRSANGRHPLAKPAPLSGLLKAERPGPTWGFSTPSEPMAAPWT